MGSFSLLLGLKLKCQKQKKNQFRSTLACVCVALYAKNYWFQHSQKTCSVSIYLTLFICSLLLPGHYSCSARCRHRHRRRWNFTRQQRQQQQQKQRALPKDIYIMCDLWFVLIEPRKTKKKKKNRARHLMMKSWFFAISSRVYHSTLRSTSRTISCYQLNVICMNRRASLNVYFEELLVYGRGIMMFLWKHENTHSHSPLYRSSSVFSHYFREKGVQRRHIMVCSLLLKKTAHHSFTKNRFHFEKIQFHSNGLVSHRLNN